MSFTKSRAAEGFHLTCTHVLSGKQLLKDSSLLQRYVQLVCSLYGNKNYLLELHILEFYPCDDEY